jgi:polyisoprenoid-binding protein YceI
MKKLLVFILLFCAFSSFSQELLQEDKESSITFIIKNFGFNVDGNFSNFKIISNFNANNLKESFINASIQVNSIFTDYKARDEHLLKSDYFDVKNYPEIVFESSAIEKSTDDKFIIKGFLTIKGIKKNIKTFLEVDDTENNIIISAKFAINRKDFDVGGSSFILSKNVNIKMIYVATKN